ncbi:MAG: amino acid adenylation domain-containing protein [Acidobacteriota bacterium]|nr:amino acid adenylation domain-containing protein [Acidobacteriota bacterium]
MTDLPTRLGSLSPAKRALLQKLLGATAPVAEEQIPRRPADAPPALSFAQQRLWFLNQLEGPNATYNMPSAFRLRGDLELDSLEWALTEIVRRHESLRTTFTQAAGRPVAVVHDDTAGYLSFVDLSFVDAAGREAEIARRAQLHAQRPFDLGRDRLLRIEILRCDQRDHVMLINMHHIVSDGWSLGVIVKEMLALYTARAGGVAGALADLPIQYADFAHWQQLRASGASLDPQVDYWRQRLADVPALLALPTDRPRPAVQTFRGTTRHFTIDGSRLHAAKALGRSCDATLFMVLSAAFATVLWRYSQQDSFVVGTPVANRGRKELEPLIGFFVNTLALRMEFAGDPSVRELIERVKVEAIGAFRHQDVPFERLVEVLQPTRHLGFSPIFQVMFILQNAPLDEVRLPGVTLEEIEVDAGTSMFDMTFKLRERAGVLEGELEYNTDLFDADTIDGVVAHYQTVLDGMVANPGSAVSRLPILSDRERDLLVVRWNDTRQEGPGTDTIVQLFEAQAARDPARIALSCEQEQLTYETLNTRANHLAAYLRSIGIGPERLVGLCLPRSADTVVGLLGILKAGGAYVPMDPAFPAERLALMAENAGLSVIVTTTATADVLPESAAVRVCLDADWDRIAGAPVPAERAIARPDHLAYVIYTSGSTGTPKGVQITHGALANFLTSMLRAPGLQRTDVLLAVTTISFDIAALELFLPLLAGARVEVISQETAADGFSLLGALQRSGATVMQATPATWQMLLATNWNGAPLTRGFCGGEALSHELALQLRDKGLELWNLYGPTETTVWSTASKVEALDALDRTRDAKVSIGRPIANTQAYILDRGLQPVPVGVAGAFYLAGDGLARGYNRRPDLTAEVFVPNPFAANGERMYKTGDLCRYRADGTIEFIGRIDNQIKLRGFRIELGEIEAVIDEHPSVTSSVVMYREDQPGRPQLVAYLHREPASDSRQDATDPVSTGQVERWRSAWNAVYQDGGENRDERFDPTGWISSYTGQPLPASDMQPWLDETVTRILSLAPRRVLEIGCGTGMLLHRIAPHVASYLGSDISELVIARLREAVARQGLRNVALSCREATARDEDDREAFDTVILNSVIQYFPTVDYLVDVLKVAIDALADGGTIFVGDVRSLPLEPLFLASVEFHRASDDCSRDELSRRVAVATRREEELLISPEFFSALASQLPRLSQAAIQVKRHRAATEMSKFRYDVVLTVGPRVDTRCPPVVRTNAEAAGLDPEGLRRLLASPAAPGTILVEHLANQRLAAELALLEWLSDPSATGSVGELRSRLASARSRDIDPMEAWQLGEAAGYDVSIRWSAAASDGRLEVLFHRGTDGDTAARVHSLLASGEAAARPWREYANDPARSAGDRQVVSEVRKRLAARLPAYMMPSSFMCLESFPLTPNGKVNRAALPAPETLVAEERYVAPRTDLERQLADIWTEVLDVPRVGMTDNFFALGGHSLLAMQLISRIRERCAIELPIHALFEAPQLGELAARVAAGATDRRPLLRPIVPIDRTTPALPLSFAQRRLWFLDRLQGRDTTYNLFGAVQLAGELNVASLEAAFRQVIRRHEVLRTTFVERDGNPVAVVSTADDFPIAVVDLEALDPDSQALEIENWMTAEVGRPFDLARDRLLRATLIRRDRHTHVLLMSIHHIVSDEWSMGVLIHELSAIYAGHEGGQAAPLPALTIQYLDYAAWQRTWLADAAIDSQREFWRGALAGAPALLELPTDRPRPALQRHRGRVRPFHIERALSDRLEALSRQSGATLFMTLLAGYSVFLHRYSGATDVVIGSPVANRVRPELESLIGFFVNTLPLRIDLSGDPSVRELLARVRQTAVAAYAHQDVPFDQLVEALRPERHLGHAPIFQVMFVLQNAPAPDLTQTALAISPIPARAVAAKFDFTMSVEPTADGLAGLIEYDTDLFDDSTIDRMTGHFRNVLASMVDQPDKRVQQLRMLGDDERRLVLAAVNTATAPAAAQPTVTRHFEAHVRRTPGAPALQVGETTISYAALNVRANQLAAELGSRGVGPEVAVGIYLNRSVDAVAALLAVLKAGGCYVPLEVSAPPARLLHMIGETRMPVIVTNRSLGPELPATTAQTLFVDELRERADALADPTPAIGHDHAAYIIYTSGSTGRPKGVAVTHDNLARAVSARAGYYADPMARLCSTLSFSFDAGNGAVWWALCQGACLVLGGDDAALHPQEVVRQLADGRCSHLITTPAIYGAILDAADRDRLAGLRTVVVGGDTLARPLVARHAEMAPQAALHNEYGPTEATWWSSVSRVDCDTAEAPTIGTAVPGCRLYVLDRALEPVPPGVTGELYIGGGQVARGYLGRPDATAEKFVPDPFAAEPGRRLYRTGDLVTRRADGDLLFIGRQDHQVKIRGFRIELGDIEAALDQHAGIRASAVVVHLDAATGAKRLAAYCVGDGAPAPSGVELQAHLKTRLPAYMVPAAFIFLDELPLTVNGKVDRRALAAAGIQEVAGSFTAPRTPTEHLLAGIWREVLGVAAVGVHDNFFELGGDSILSIQIISRANRAGLGLTVKQLFEQQTIAELARVAPDRRTAPAEQGLVTGPVPLTPIQRWFFDGSPSDPHHCNQAVLLMTESRLDPGLVEQSLHHLMLHHDGLRTRIDLDGGLPTARIDGGGVAVPFTVCDLSGVAAPEASLVLTADADRQQRSLHLSAGPLIRSVLYRMASGEPDRLLLVIHHLVVDGVSWRILIEDFALVYGQLRCGDTVRLPEKTTSFRRWAERLHEYAATAEVSAEASWWRDVIDTPITPLPRDYGRDLSDNTCASADEVVVQLPAAMTQALLTRVPGAYRTQINDVLLTALTRSMANWTGGDDLRIMLEGHGREELFDDVDVSRTVGVFTSFFPVVLSRASGEGPGDTLKRVKERLRAVPLRGMRFGLLKYLQPADGIAGCESVAEVVFNYLGRFDSQGRNDVFTGLAPESTGANQSEAGQRRYPLEINSVLNDSTLELSWSFSTHLHRRETIAALAADFIRELEQLIDHCADSRHGGYTASDFALCRLADDTLETLFARWGRGVEDAYPLAPMQLGMLFHAQFEQHTGVDVIQLSCRLEGDLRPDLFQGSWQLVLDRHPALRTAFIAIDGDDPLQVVLEGAELPWQVSDWRGVSESQRADRLAELLEADRLRGFAIDQPPLMRCALIRIEATGWQFVWTHHHLLTDGWCLPILLTEALAIYQGLLSGRAIAPHAGRPFRDYLHWLSQQDHVAAESFWRANLAGFTAPTRLGIDRVGAAAGESRRFPTAALTLSAETTRALHQLAQQRRVTLSVLIQAAWAVLLGRYAGAADIVFGAVVSGRPPDIANIDSMIGLFINTLPVRVTLADSEPVVALLARLQDEQVARDAFAYAPLADIQRWSQVPAPDPLFESAVVFENYPMDEALGQAGGPFTVRDFELREQTNLPITLMVAPAECLPLRIAYDESRFDRPSIDGMLSHLGRLLERLVADPRVSVADWEMMAAAERHRLVHEWNNTQTRPAGRAHTLAALFETQVRTTPASVAAIFGDTTLTYEQLNHRANQLARRLRAAGVADGSTVGLFMERSLDMLIGLLAVTKAGAAYVPMDPMFPSERLRHMLSDAQVALVLTERALVESVPKSGARVLCIDDEGGHAGLGGDNLERPAHPTSPAYVIYTSGSTGTPKGVAVSGAALVNLLLSMQERPGLSEHDVMLAVTTISFDIAALELFLPLVTGATVVIASRDMARDGAALLGEMQRTGATIMQATPVTWRLLLEAQWPGAPLTRALCGGEALPRDLAAQLLATGVELWNVYGPTETTIWSTVHQVSNEAPFEATEPIGKPIANTQTYVVDRRMNPVPIGVGGELLIGGDGVANGYVGRGDLTAERFVPDPFGATPGGRLYRTGDLVRFRADGSLVFLGRLDSQVKVRGFRIELGEVEAALSRHPDVAQAVVIARTASHGENELIGYLVTVGGVEIDDQALRTWLGQSLPAYMIPTHVTVMSAFPLTPNGKVARRQLPLPDPRPQHQHVPPVTATEERMARIWSEVFQLPEVGIDDSFFELGGHSLLAAKVVGRIRAALNVSVPLPLLFRQPTIRQVSAFVDNTVWAASQGGPDAAAGHDVEEVAL